MTFVRHYKTPDGFDDLFMESDGEALTGLGFAGSHDGNGKDGPTSEIPAFRETCCWLDIYFSGRQPDFTPQYRLVGATPFREAVSREMRKIPFGATATYGDIAATIAKKRGLARMSAQAVGQAVGWNPICIIIPCHRVVGAGGTLTGYGGGLRNKIALLELEGSGYLALHAGLRFLALREEPQLKAAAAAWFHAKWGVPETAYLECMEAYISGKTEYGWYLCLDGDRIVGGLGVIENDFHERKDLTPNICAVYVEESHRHHRIAGRLLDMAVEDLRSKGISPVYLLTDHTGFYERYGWEFLCLAHGDGEEKSSRMYVHR